jgi:hypothetical protein
MLPDTSQQETDNHLHRSDNGMEAGKYIVVKFIHYKRTV